MLLINAHLEGHCDNTPSPVMLNYRACLPKAAEKKHHYIVHELLSCECGKEFTQVIRHLAIATLPTEDEIIVNLTNQSLAKSYYLCEGILAIQ